MQKHKITHKLWGKVRHGDKRGRDLGYPTANIDLHRTDISAGVYIGTTIIDTISYESIVFIGPAKTFGNTQWRIETHILDFDQDIYEATVKVHLHKKIRANKRFSTITDLVDQIEKDIQAAKIFFMKAAK